MRSIAVLLLAATLHIAAFGAAYSPIQNNPINVKDRGQIGDGTDATTVIQAAANLAVSEGRELYIPDGDYPITTLLLTNSISIYLSSGARVFQNTNSDVSMIQFRGDNAATLRIYGGTLDGNKAARAAYWDSVIDLASIIDSTNGNKRLYMTGVTFTNSVRAAIRTAGFLDVEQCLFVAPNEHNGTSHTFCIFAQPVGYTDSLTMRVANSEFVATSTAEADLYKQASGIFLTQDDSGAQTNVFKEVIVIGNRSRGIGTTRAGNISAFLDTYNGVHRLVAVGNHVTGYAYSAFKIQRCDDAIITDNTIENGTNTDDNECFAITWSPRARNGSIPFTGSRTNENHFNFICANNVIRNTHRTAIYIDGSSALVQGNFIDGMLASDTSFNLPLVVVGNNVTVTGNQLRNVPVNGIWVVQSTNVTVANNSFSGTTPSDTLITLNQVQHAEVSENFLIATNATTAAGIWMDDSEHIRIERNWMKFLNTPIDIRDSTNVHVVANFAFDYVNPLGYDADTVGLWIGNNSWQPWQYRRDTNGVTYISVQNVDTNTSSRALYEVINSTGGGFFQALPTNSVDTVGAGMVQLGAYSGSTGIESVWANTNQSFRVRLANTNYLTVLPQQTKVYGDWQTPFAIDSRNATLSLIQVFNQGVQKSFFGWSSSLPGFIVLNDVGSVITFGVGNDGDATLAGSLSLSGQPAVYTDNGSTLLRDGVPITGSGGVPNTVVNTNTVAVDSIAKFSPNSTNLAAATSADIATALGTVLSNLVRVTGTPTNLVYVLAPTDTTGTNGNWVPLQTILTNITAINIGALTVSNLYLRGTPIVTNLTTWTAHSAVTNFVVDLSAPSYVVAMAGNMYLLHSTNSTANFVAGNSLKTEIEFWNSSGGDLTLMWPATWKTGGNVATNNPITVTNGTGLLLTHKFSGRSTSQTNNLLIAEYTR